MKKKRFFLTLVGVICSLNMFAAVTDLETTAVMTIVDSVETVGTPQKNIVSSVNGDLPPIITHTSGFATYSSAVKFKAPEGFNVYKAKILRGGENINIGLIKIQEGTFDYIPAGVGVIFYGAAGQELPVEEYEGEGTPADMTNNDLKATTTLEDEVEVEQNSYVLTGSENTDICCFKKYSGNEYKSNRAYLVIEE